MDLEVCVEAIDGEEAIQKALMWNPDLIILDTAMPVLDGLGAARKIKGLQPKVPILILSNRQWKARIACSRYVTSEGVFQAKRSPILTKPGQESELDSVA